MLRTRPSEPFRIHVSDGSHYDVRHPELARVDRSKVIVGVPGPKALDDPVHDTVICAILHINRIEFLNGAAGGRSRRAGSVGFINNR